MILINNINILRDRLPLVWNTLDMNRIKNNKIKVTPAKNGLPTMSIEVNGQEIYMNSKYNPLQEAERLVEQIKDVDSYDHVLFYGMGLGYHIEILLKKYAHISFSLYEPNEEVFTLFLENRQLNEVLPLSRLKEFYIQTQKSTNEKELIRILDLIATKKVLFVSLPSYERIFKEQYEQFTKLFKQMVSRKTSSLKVNVSFEKRWVLNSLRNLTKVIQTPNIMHDIDKKIFKGKPAVLVAAGPSLEEDIEYIRYIKQNSLAFIFAVGSAISVLLKYDILPDAACTYDPGVNNYKVFEKIISKGISSVPMIFGSSVGYETLISYPGPMVHMITTQDTISSLFCRSTITEQLQRVDDAPSIAVITLQLLHSLECSPIILAGQNLAFKDEKRYSSGIAYYEDNNKVNEQELKNAILVEDVNGKSIYTNKSFDSMRKVLETYACRYTDVEIINTTKGGARIQGTQFQTIENVIRDKLCQPVKANWYVESKNSYDMGFLASKVEFMSKQHKILESLFQSLLGILRTIDRIADANRQNEFDRMMPKIDKVFHKIDKNLFYLNIIRPMKRVQYENLLQQIAQLRFNKDLEYKGRMIVEQIGKYLGQCLNDMNEVKPIWANIAQGFPRERDNNV